MKRILFLVTILMMNLSFAEVKGTKCYLADPFDDWSLEFSGDTLAFWDNQQWSLASYTYTLEGVVPTDVYTSLDPSDSFIAELSRGFDGEFVAVLRLQYRTGVESFDFVCSTDQVLYYFSDL
jgi:hypothetical protein